MRPECRTRPHGRAGDCHREIKLTSIVSRIRRGSLWIAASNAVVNALGVVSTIVMARLLTPADFGVVAIGLTVLAIVHSVTDLSLAQALINVENPDEHHIDCAWTLNVLRGLLVGMVVAALGYPAAGFYGDDRLVAILTWMGASVFVASLANPRLAMFERDLVFRQRFLVQTVAKLTLVFVSIAVAWQTRSYVALVAGAVASPLAQVALSYAIAPHMPRPRLKEARSLLSFSWWLTLTQIVRTINFRFEPLLIGKFVTVHTLGLFTVSRNIAGLPTREATAPLTATLFPAFRHLRDQPERLRNAYMRAQTLISAIALPAGMLMAILAEPIVLLALGRKWIEAVPVIQVLAIALATETLGTALQPLAMAHDRNDLLFRRSLQGLVTRVPLTLLGLILAGLPGYLAARVSMVVPGILFNKVIIRDLIGLPVIVQLQHNWRTMLAAVAMALLGFAIAPLFDLGPGHVALLARIAIVGAICGGAYLAILFGLWLLTHRPVGPENEFVDAFGTLLRKMKQVLRVQSA